MGLISWKVLVLIMVLSMSFTAVSQDSDKKLGWFFEAEMAGVWTVVIQNPELWDWEQNCAGFGQKRN